MKPARALGGVIVLIAAAVALAWYGTGWNVGETWRLHTPAAGTWLLALSGLGLSYVMRAMRLRAEWRGERELAPARCLQVILIHAAAVNLLPLRSGEAGFPWLLRRYWRIGWADAAASLLWMRLQDAAVLAWLAALSALAVLRMQGAIGAPLAIGWGLGATGVLLAWAVFGARWSVALAGSATQGPQRRARIAQLLGALATAAARAAGRANFSTWGWSLGNWIVKIAALGALLAAFADLDGPQAWCAALGGEVAAALPVQPPAGFGTYEAAVALAGAMANAGPAPRLLAAALAIHLLVLATSMAGAALAWVAGHDVKDASCPGDAA